MTQQHMATWPESPKRVRKKILTHAKDTPRSHTKRLSSPSRDLASLGISYFSADISKNRQSRRVGQLLGAVAVYHACLLAVWS